MRILPHHQDTGGFFIAVLEKVKPLLWESDTTTKLDISNTTLEQHNLKESQDENNKTVEKKRTLNDEKKPWGPQRKRKRIQGYREDPFVFFQNENEDVWPSIKEFYHISDELDPRCLLVRCHEGKKKNIYFTSPAIRDIVLCNENKVKIINTGVKTFVRCDNKNMACAFRLAQEGLNSIVHFIGDCRKVKVFKDDLIMLLQNDNHLTPPEITKLNQETQERLKNFAKGSCVLIYEEQNTNNPYPLKFEMVGWRGIISLRVYVSIHDAIHYLRLLGGDCSMFEKNKFQVNRDLIASKIEEEKIAIINDYKQAESVDLINSKQIKCDHTSNKE